MDAPPGSPRPYSLAVRVALAVALAVTVLSGLLLLFFYDRRDPHGSILAMASWLQVVRSVHHASASLLVLLLLWRLVELLVVRAPRFAWWATSAALFAALAGLEMGIVLRGDQWGHEALLHDRSVPGAGILTVPIAFWVHLAAAAAVVGSLVAGTRAWTPQGRDAVNGFVRALRVRAGAWAAPAALVLLAVGALALLAPATLGPAPFPALEVMRPVWPFLWIDPLEDRWGLVVLLEAPVIAALVLALYPFAAPPRRPALPFVLLLAVMAVLGLIGAFTRVRAHMAGGP